MRFYFLGLATAVVVCVGCVADGDQMFPKQGEYVAPPAAMLQRPGPMVDGPGPGVIPMMGQPITQAAHAAMARPMMGAAAVGHPHGPGGMPMPSLKTSQVRFIGPTGMVVGWMVPGGFAENQLVSPARYNFPQNATYRLKLSNLPGRQGLDLYPTLEVYPSLPQTDAYLTHNSLPIDLTVEDLDQVESNNFVTKVIYLPDAAYQELAIAGVETLVSTPLDPGFDPVAEADRRGTIMAVLRVGNADLEMGVGPAGVTPAGLKQVQYDGDEGKFVPPMPISSPGTTPVRVPAPPVMGVAQGPGMPGVHPVAGVTTGKWGTPITGTPIGLPGPPHLPYAGPAGLQSHTVRNVNPFQPPKPVSNMLIDVKQDPAPSIPDPVSYIYYEESHPVHSAGEVNYPASYGGAY
ncbi:MAG: hypothetical protein AAF532_15740 [Planctomycetota bacterium]